MRDAETVLGIINERGKRGLPLEDVYRQLFNPRLYLQAYARLYSNHGAMTPGATGETVDGMSLEKIGAIIDAVRHERYRWTPAKRVYIPKKSGKRRPLGLPPWSDKLLQDVIRSILEAYYEPQFSRHSHGFRPRRGCHTALADVKSWQGTRWFIEGDIAQCFDKLDHEVLLAILGEKIHDNRFLRLLACMLKAGYLEEWTWHATLSGSPQGGVVSPALSNIYLDKLDNFVETTLLPAYNRGTTRRKNREYYGVQDRLYAAQAAGNHTLARDLTKQRRTLPEGDPDDPTFRRLRYARYADDFLLGFIGPKAEAEEIKVHLTAYLQEQLKLTLSPDKTLITHARTNAARFLGYEVVSQHADDRITDNRRCINGRLALRVPREVITAACTRYLRGGKPTHRPELQYESDYAIVTRFQMEYRGLVQYYILAHNVHALGRVHFAARPSLLRTLANKHKTASSRIARKYGGLVATPFGVMKCLRVVIQRGEGKKPLVAQFGGIPLRRKETAVLTDKRQTLYIGRSDLLRRLLADTCELCGYTGNCQVHHIRKLADLRKSGRRAKPNWMTRMVAMRRKTLVVCRACHVAIHAGRPTRHLLNSPAGEPDDTKASSPVRRGADGKGH